MFTGAVGGALDAGSRLRYIGWARAGSLTLRYRAPVTARPGSPLTLGIRPEAVRVGPVVHADAENRLTARVTSVQFQGASTRLGLEVAGAPVVTLECDLAATALAELDVKEGAEAPVSLPPEALRVFGAPDA